MKTPSLAFALLLCCLLSSAQTDFRFADSTAVWHLGETEYMEIFGPPGGTMGDPFTRIYQVQKDSFFNNHSYQKIIPNNRQISFIRKDSTGLVYWYDTSLQSDKVIYDFGLEEGDTITLNTKTEWQVGDTLVTLVVDSVDSLAYGFLRKRLFMRCISNEDWCMWGGSEDIWIEGIGSLRSYFLRPYTHEFTAIPGNGFELLCFTEKGVTYNFSSNCYVGVEDILLDAHSLILSPNPATTQLRVELGDASASLKTIQLYSVTGKEVLRLQASGQAAVLNTQQLAAGVYFCRVALEDGSFAVKKILIER